MRFSQDFLQTLRDRFLLSELAAPHVRLKKQGQEYSGLCPFHKEKSPSFTLNDQKGVFHCFGCGAGGDTLDFYMRSHNMDFTEAVKEMAYKAGLPLPQSAPLTPEEAEQNTIKEQLYPLMEDVCLWYQEQLTQNSGHTARDYFNKRRIQPKTIELFRLGYAPSHSSLKQEFMKRGYQESLLIHAGLLTRKDEQSTPYDRFRNRIIFPILDKRNRVIGFGGRVLDDSKPKYLNSPETPLFSKRHSLYGWGQARKLTKKEAPLIVVEGYMDVLALHQAGYTGVVAPLGTALTEEQIPQLWTFNPEPTVCFDGDEAGRRAAYRVIEKVLPLLKPGFSLQFAQLPSGEDPDSLVQQHAFDTLESVLSQTQSLLELLWQHGVAEQRTKTPEQQALVKQNIFARIQTIQNLTVRSLYQQTFKERFYQAFRGQSYTTRKSVLASAQEQRGGIRSRFESSKWQRYAVLAALINYPHVFASRDEQIAQLEFPEIELENLKQDILNIFHNHPDLDDLTMKHHILARGYKHIVETIVSSETYVHASFAKPGLDESEVLRGWQEVVHFMQIQKTLKADVKQMKSEFATHFNLNAWKRFQSLKKQSLSGQ